MKRKVVITLVIVAAAAAIFYLPDRWDTLLTFARWAESSPHLAWPLYLAVFVLAVVLMIPGWIFMVIGGYLFGIPLGIALAFTANLTGSISSFYLSRTFARRWVAARLEGSTRFQAFDASVARNGFFANLFARLALLPNNLLNYACGLTAIRLSDFVLGTALGTLPILLANVLIGAGTEDLD